MKKNTYALGMVETIGFPAMFAAADAASKAADVKIATYQGADSGIVTIYIVGDVASVQSAVAVGTEVAKRVGQFRHSHVLARPDDHVMTMIFPELAEQKQDQPNDPPGEKIFERVEQPIVVPNKENSDVKFKDLNKKNIQELRKLANSLTEFPLSPQEISTAKKEDLIKHLNEFQDGKGGDKL
ncbi:BMC domain-containing protein [Pseudobacillus wudalianchiensis]|uniref:BMC domain-containing protein n=1 Tax=Pseudobacillus wudalianchiensis TaxID=1743143 RepID=A0A1B9B6L7_9BACI|nr:BMC domain-containing protein [Bacillus wudalianchiensis]OCA91760.1 hypothetical protein A8F95_20325 [Bacillus wudalianchiensis]